MPKRTDIESILIIGAGPIIIGQACEFDYSGTQAIRALKEEGYRVVLVNSNPATIMTDPDLADATYIEPLTREYLELVIKKEKPDAILPTVGGQTGLNLALELHTSGFLQASSNVLQFGTSSDDRVDFFANNTAHVSLHGDGEFIVNETGNAEGDFRVESNSNTHMLFVDGGNDHVNIGTATDLSGVLNVDGNISLSGAGTGNRSIALLTETGSYAGTLRLQAGGISSAFGGAIIMYGHSHASKPGDVALGISSGSGGSFRVNADGVDTSVDRLSVTEAGAFTTNPGGGHHAVFNEGGVDVDFRVESNGNTHALFVDGGNDVVNFGTSNHTLFNNSSDLYGASIGTSGLLQISRNSGTMLFLNRQNANGEMIDLRFNGSQIGSIGSSNLQSAIVSSLFTGA